MEWCRACGGRLTAEDRLCPWCRAPLPAPSRHPAGGSARDRLPDSTPYSLDELEDEIPSFDEPPFARTREERSERSAGDTSRPRSPTELRPASRERTSTTQAAPPSAATAPRAHLALAPRADPIADRRELGWRLDDPPLEAEAQRAASVRGARFLPRAVAFAIDLVVLGLLNGALFATTVVALGFAAALRSGSLPAPGVLFEAIFTAGQIALFFGYFGLLHSGPGQTLGKALVGLRVIGSDGRDLAMSRSLLRAGAYVFSALPLGIGFLLGALPAGRALHDYLIGSRVIEVGGS